MLMQEGSCVSHHFLIESFITHTFYNKNTETETILYLGGNPIAHNILDECNRSGKGEYPPSRSQ